MALTLSVATRNAKVSAAVGRLDAGTGPGVIQIRDGTRPASADDAATGTLLATVTLADPAFGASANGVANLVDPAAVSAVAAGTASWFRAQDSAGGVVFDGSVTATGAGGDLTLSTTAITVGLSVDVTSGTYTQPAG